VVWDILLPAFAAVLVLKQYTDVGLSGGDHAVDCFVPCVIHAGWGCAAIRTAHFGHQCFSNHNLSENIAIVRDGKDGKERV